MNRLTCCEWNTYTPESDAILAGRDLGDARTRRLATELAATDRIRVLELRQGLQVETTQYVGSLRLGDLCITIQPKLTSFPLLTLLRYAYGLRDLMLLEAHPQGTAESAFQDLLFYQLAAEVGELLARGLRRRYVPRDELLASPQGRIDFASLARLAGMTRAALPCTHHPRLADNPLNRAMLAALRLAIRLTDDLDLRVQLRRQAAQMEGGVTAVPLTADALKQAYRASDRLATAYRPALAIAELLLGGQGTALRDGQDATPVPGFLFDMNRFFQALLSRFLREGLPDHEIRDEARLRGMLAYDERRNPRRRQAPSPRPDFMVLAPGKKTMAILDAKYRDLWERPLPRDMLYQLAIYAGGGTLGRATILYPTLIAGAQEACIEVRDPVSTRRLAEVILRPVNMGRLAEVVGATPGVARQREVAAFASWLVFG